MVYVVMVVIRSRVTDSRYHRVLGSDHVNSLVDNALRYGGGDVCSNFLSITLESGPF